MYTLKIRWERYDFDDNVKTVDESTMFIPANSVHVHGEVTSINEMKAWQDSDYMSYPIIINKNGDFNARLIHVINDNVSTWYLASKAWLLGPEGKTIERVAP